MAFLAAASRRAGTSLARTLSSSAAPAASSSSSGVKDRLIIFDTTLRDGEQSPGCTLQLHEKVAIAHQLCRLGVDVCEAGFPVASPGDFEAVRRIAVEVGPLLAPGREAPMTIAGLARATEKDIDRCFEAVRHAPRHRIHTFLATSDIHLQHKLRITRAEAIERAVKAVRHAASLCSDVEFSTEDGGRSDHAFLAEAIGAVIEAGATTINVPDTVGYTLPHEYGDLFAYLVANTRGADKVVWSTHCHNDLGLAVANTLAAVRAGARQVEVTVNGLGERAGNTSLEEVVMTIATRPQHFPVRTGIDTTQIMRSSKLVSHLTGMVVQPNKAIVGANAFAHESGVHQDGMLKNSSTYEIMTPASVGLQRSSLVLGKHSGRAAFSQRLKELGFAVESKELDALVERFKALADEKKVLTDADIEAIVYSGVAQPDDVWTLHSAHVFTGTGARPTATVTLTQNLPAALSGGGASSRGGAKEVAAAAASKKAFSPVEKSMSAMGSGPIDAVYNAIKAVVGRPNDLVDFAVKSVTDGQNALGEVTIKIAPPAQEGTLGQRRVEHLKRVSMQDAGKGAGITMSAASFSSSAAASASAASPSDPSLFLEAWEQGASPRSGPIYSGVATDRDIIVAAARAYVAALNRMIAAEEAGAAGRVIGAGDIGAAV